MKMRAVSAFLFALCLVVAAYGALWSYAMKQAEEGLSTTLKTVLGENAIYDAIEWEYDFSRVHLKVQGFEWVVRDMQSSARLLLKADKVDFVGDLLSPFKMVLSMPTQMQLMLEDGDDVALYDLFTDNMELAYYAYGSAQEFIVSADSFSLRRGGETTLSGKSTFLLRKPSGQGARWSFAVNGLNSALNLYKDGAPIEEIVTEFSLSQPTGAPIISFATQVAKSQARDAERILVQWLGMLAEKGITLDVTEFRVESPKDWITLHGLLQVNSGLMPGGSVRVASNSAEKFYGMMVDVGLLPTHALERYGVRKKLVLRDGEMSITMATSGNEVIYNGLDLGKVKSVPQILNLQKLLP